MDFLFFILDDNYEMFFNSISTNSINKIVLIINDEFESSYGSDYSKVDEKMLRIMKRTKEYIILKKSFCLREYVNVSNKQYLRSMPCFLCSQNKPCEKCYQLTPFDIFNIKNAKNRFLSSCRPRKHLCIYCYSKK